MSWKEKISYSEMINYCDVYRSRKEIQEHFKLTNIESWHACKWFSKFPEDFQTVNDVGDTGKAIWLKSTKEAKEHNF